MHASARASGRVALTGFRSLPLEVDEVRRAVLDESAGGHALFVGTVRNHDQGRAVQRLVYSCHPSAPDTLAGLAGRIAARAGIVAVAGLHRTGELSIGDIAVVLAVSAAHRGHAFEACEEFIDALKREVPVWKEQVFADGTREWVDHA